MTICGHHGSIQWRAGKGEGKRQREKWQTNTERIEEETNGWTDNNVSDQMRQRLKRRINKVVMLYSPNEGGQSGADSGFLCSCAPRE